MTPHRLACLFAAAAVGACGQLPELGTTISDSAARAPYPQLVPVEQLRAGAAEESITPETAEEVEARADGLRHRAAGLRGAVLDSASRSRLEQKVE